MKRCPRCALPETFPGIEFHQDGVCNYCIYHNLFAGRIQGLKALLRAEFEKAVDKARQIQNGYHCILCYSGGKDSTFLLHLLKTRYKLNPLVYTLDNGFISPQALRNIARVVDCLEVDHVFFRPRSAMVKDLFREALTNKRLFNRGLVPYASQCCLSCISMVLGVAMKMGQEKNIPLVMVGFTPGQAAYVGIESFIKTGSTVFTATEVNRDDPVDLLQMIRDPLHEVVGEEIDHYVLKSQYLEEGEHYPRVLYPYHAMVEYNEEEIYQTIAQYGWTAPRDTDACSTNCRLNSVAIVSHVNDHGYHPYIAEMSCLVREGQMSYEEAVAREGKLPPLGVMNDVLAKLNLTLVDLGLEKVKAVHGAATT